MVTGRLYDEGTLLRVALAHEQRDDVAYEDAVTDIESGLGARGSGLGKIACGFRL